MLISGIKRVGGGKAFMSLHFHSTKVGLHLINFKVSDLKLRE